MFSSRRTCSATGPAQRYSASEARHGAAAGCKCCQGCARGCKLRRQLTHEVAGKDLQARKQLQETRVLLIKWVPVHMQPLSLEVASYI